MKIRYLFIIIICCCTVLSFGQRDTLFWFAVPEIANTPTFPSGPLDRPILLHISAFGSASVVTVSQPARPAFTPIILNVPSNGNATLNLTPFIDSLENLVPDVVHDYGIKVTATQLIAVYYEESSQANPELFTLKGRNAVGSDFFIPSQTYLNNVNQYSPLPFSSFDIIATENNTTVTITPSKNIVGHVAGATYNVTLNLGQTYSAKATSQLAAQHLNGSRVISNKPIAITIKDDLLNSGTAYAATGHDIGGDQIIPVNKLGTEYIPVRGRLVSPFDKIFVLATQNNTTITQDGTLMATINSGVTQMLNMTSTSRSTYIQTNNPVYVLQLTGHGGEVGIDVLPPVECTGSSQVAYTRSTADSLFLMFLVRSGGEGDFLFNGSAGIINAASFTAVPGTGGQWLSAFIIISTAQLAQNATVVVKNTSHLFHMGVINGSTGAGARFGYFSDFNSFFVQANSNSLVCPGSQLQLNADSIQGASYSWTGPNGFSSTLQDPVKNNFSVADTGTYTLTVDQSGCISTSIVTVAISNLPTAFNLGNDTSYCNSFTRVLSTGNPNTVWSTGVTASQITVNSSGTYSAAIANSCGTARDTIVISQGLILSLSLGPDTSICSGQSITLQSPLTGSSYLWSTGATTSSIIVNTTGMVWLQVDQNGCIGRDSINIGLQTPPLVFSIGSDTVYCGNFTRTLSTGNVNTLWSTGTNASQISVSTPGTYWAQISNACGSKNDSIVISQNQLPIVSLGPDSFFCAGQTLILATASTGTYLWSTGATTSSVTLNLPGSVWLQVTENGCVNSDTVIISQQNPPASFSLGSDSTYCGNFTHTLTTGNTSALWSTGVNATQITVSNPGIYWALISNSCGSQTDSITLSQNPIPGVSLGPDTFFCVGQNLTINTVSTGTYLWSTGATTAAISVNLPGVVWLEISENGCLNRDSLSITQLNPPAAFSLGNDTTYCGNFIRNISTGNVSTLWSTGITASSIQVNQPGLFWATITNNCGLASDSILIAQIIPPSFSLIPDTSICTGDSLQIAAIANAGNYLWSVGSTTSTIVINQPGIYWAEAWDSASCRHRDSVNIGSKTAPVFSLGRDTALCSGSDFVLKPRTAGLQYVWQDQSTDSVYHVIASGTYSVSVSNECGSSSDEVHIDYYVNNCLMAIPTAFSPNSDGKNDLFRPFSACPIEKFSIHIFNRWGEVVFESTDPFSGWDGTFRGVAQPISTFVYYLEYFNYCEGKIKKQSGNLTLVR